MTETSSMAANRASCEKLQQQSLQKCNLANKEPWCILLKCIMAAGQRVAYLAYAMDQMGCKMSHLRFDIRHCQSKSLGGFEIDENGQPIVRACDLGRAYETINLFRWKRSFCVRIIFRLRRQWIEHWHMK